MRRSPLFLLALVALLCLAILPESAHALCKCKDSNQAVGPCQVKLNGCGCIHKWKWAYKCSATAAPTGHEYNYEWAKSGEGAAKNAILGLFQQMTAEGECNCESGAAPVGTCSFPYRACFYFASESALDAKTASFRAIVTAPGGAVTQVNDFANGQDAVAAGVKAAIAANPALAAQCGLGQ